MNRTQLLATLAATLALVLPAPLTLAEDGYFVWVNPSSIAWVPAPLVVHAMAPTALDETCTGYSEIEVPDVPGGASVTVRAESEACALVAVDLEWTVDGRTYAGALDLATFAVERIVLVAEEPSRLAGAKGTEAPLAWLARGDVTEPMVVPLKSADQPDPGGRVQGYDGTYGWAEHDANGTKTFYDTRDGHSWNHLWSRAGVGNEDVKVNYGWKFNGQYHQPLSSSTRCTSDGNFYPDSCDHCVHGNGCQDGTNGASGHGHYHEQNWGRTIHQHYVGARFTPKADQTSGGSCYHGGDLPWWYAVECKVGPGLI